MQIYFLFSCDFLRMWQSHLVRRNQATLNTMTTIITNTFTGYAKTITTKGFPSVKTIAKHVRASKAKECKSATCIYIDGEGFDLSHGELIANGQYA